MNEEQTTKEEVKETATANSGKGDKPETIEIIKRQSERIKELEDANLKREEEQAKKQLGGETFAGKPSEKKEVISPEEYSSQILKGIIPK